MDQKQSEAAPHVEFQHPKAYASHYEAGQGGDNTDDAPESGGSWRKCLITNLILVHSLMICK